MPVSCRSVGSSRDCRPLIPPFTYRPKGWSPQPQSQTCRSGDSDPKAAEFVAPHCLTHRFVPFLSLFARDCEVFSDLRRPGSVELKHNRQSLPKVCAQHFCYVGCSDQHRSIGLRLAEPLCGIYQEKGADLSCLH